MERRCETVAENLKSGQAWSSQDPQITLGGMTRENKGGTLSSSRIEPVTFDLSAASTTQEFRSHVRQWAGKVKMYMSSPLREGHLRNCGHTFLPEEAEDYKHS
jgi:hypothetical protein